MPIEIKPVIVADDGINRKSKSVIKPVIVANDGVNTVKKKRKYYLKFGRFFIGYSERGSNRAIGIFWRKSR